MDNNFKDPVTNEEFHFTHYRVMYSSSGHVSYRDKNNQLIKNQSTGTVLEFIEPEPKVFEAPFLGKTNNRAATNEMLKKRSHEHFKREISEVKYEKNKDLIKKYKD